MDFSTIASVIGLSSIVSIVFSIILGHFDKRQMIRFETLTHEKMNIYSSMLTYMVIVIEPEKLEVLSMGHELAKKVENKSKDEIIKLFLKEIEAKYTHSHLYASDSVLKAVDKFITAPNYINYKSAAFAMRKDLWKHIK